MRKLTYNEELAKLLTKNAVGLIEVGLTKEAQVNLKKASEFLDHY